MWDTFVLWLSQQRPRKVGARFTGASIAQDEHFQVNLDLDYDGKRDRWNGYDPEEHQRIVEEYAKVDLVSSQGLDVFLVFQISFYWNCLSKKVFWFWLTSSMLAG